MKEVEMKARVKDLESIKNKLIKMGCTFSIPLLQKDIIFLHDSMKIRNMKKGKIALRIRNVNDEKYILTLKKQLRNTLDNIEKEVCIDSSEQAKDMLKYMGYKEVVRVNKTRIEAKYRDMTICLDEVERLGTFIEVEKLAIASDSKEIQKNLSLFLEHLGIPASDCVLKGYDTLLSELTNNTKKL